MDRKLIGAMLLLFASCGCCACDSSCDYLPPVIDGPYSSSSQGMRTGSTKDPSFQLLPKTEFQQPVVEVAEEETEAGDEEADESAE